MKTWEYWNLPFIQWVNPSGDLAPDRQVASVRSDLDLIRFQIKSWCPTQPGQPRTDFLYDVELFEALVRADERADLEKQIELLKENIVWLREHVEVLREKE
jgi:hypothetical protein